MPSGLMPGHYGAPRHFSLPSIQRPQTGRNQRLVAGHCEKYNFFYIRDPSAYSLSDCSNHLAFMRYRRVKDNVVRLDGMHVPNSMKGRGVSSALAREVLNYMTQKNVWVDVKCPITREYLKQNQYAQYVRQMVNPQTLRTRCKTTLY